MANLAHGLTQHNCDAAGRSILLPVTMENYNSRVIVSAKCAVCNKTEFEKQLDKANAPTKGFYMTV